MKTVGDSSSAEGTAERSRQALRAWLDRWVRVGLIEPGQRDAIASYERGEPTVVVSSGVHPPRLWMPVVAEVLAYVGAVLALAGVLLVVTNAWSNLDTAYRIVISGGGAAALAGIGFAIPEQRSGVLLRLRAVVWLLASAAAAVFGVVVMRDAWGTGYGASIAWSGATCALVLSAALWC